MRTMILAIMLCLFGGAAFAQAAATWEVRKNPNGRCEVVKASSGPATGTRVAGPYKNKKRAEDELVSLRKTPKCKK